ncbi:sensor histidine kinase [Colwellia ponticola]|uniref:histidine kinase n=1 Tax=Colwellia ponticola TaxID=2304625 RepID=A0A8H2JKY5_9GAMM|nr:HAMP domain-containing sensor histidine kinase [Colwellia ponticola]TMM45049.1 HAMP domain-containing histidine kinase [Colwellia ponticola]
MKITPSIRLFVLLSMLLSGIAIIWGLSVLSSKYFIAGMDMGTRNGMFAFAQQQQGEKTFTFVSTPGDDNKNTARTVTYTLVKDWQKVPAILRQQFTADELQLNQLYKYFVELSLFTPPKTASFIMKIIKNDEIHYVTLVASKNNLSFQGITDVNHFTIIAFTASGVITLFSIILWFVMRQVTLPVIRLKQWAKKLDNTELLKPMPDFHYRELNTLAALISNSLHSVQDSLVREKKFLGYASHELRTPIATSRSNVELLKKLIESDAPSEKQLLVLARVLRATLNMTDLTETLLWLNRSEGKELIAREFQLGVLIEQLADELKYLTVDKVISVSIETDRNLVNLPESVCRIIISNLIRNAFQHTTQGQVTIKQVSCQLTIVNQNNSDDNGEDIFADDNLGFGLGLSLTERIIKQYQWQYCTTDICGGKNVSVTFQTSTT